MSNTEFTTEPICTASRQYQKLKIEQLTALDLDENEYKKRFDSVIVKACICHDLGQPADSNDEMNDFSSAGPTMQDGWPKPDLVTSGRSVVSLAAPGSTVYNQNPSARV